MYQVMSESIAQAAGSQGDSGYYWCALEEKVVEQAENSIATHSAWCPD